ncbi:MAG: type II secretion system protein [Alphaproteobacteria bacterium]|nr:type II secretion system GspH family protein [Alphaproteobacteria bacterium]MDE2336315.1 type II secretion system protein [Alphaproteobacteria bacterium]
MKKYKSPTAGFTLLEVAIVLIIGGLLIAAAASMLLSYMKESRIITTQSRMTEIDNALIAYLTINNALPCPASFTDTQDTTTFGRELTDTTAYSGANADCYQNAGAATGTFRTTGRISGTNTTGYIVIGAVPVRTLNLPDTDIADAWGDRFTYAVTDWLTTAKQYAATLGSIDVVDSGGNSIPVPPQSAQYVILSYGPDGAGAYTLAGKQGVACPGGAVETTNCTLPTPKFVSTMLNSTVGANAYDDLLVWHAATMPTIIIPPNMVAPFVQNVCPGGWMPFAGAGCTPPASGVCCQKE